MSSQFSSPAAAVTSAAAPNDVAAGAGGVPATSPAAAWSDSTERKWTEALDDKPSATADQLGSFITALENPSTITIGGTMLRIEYGAQDAAAALASLTSLSQRVAAPDAAAIELGNVQLTRHGVQSTSKICLVGVTWRHARKGFPPDASFTVRAMTADGATNVFSHRVDVFGHARQRDASTPVKMRITGVTSIEDVNSYLPLIAPGCTPCVPPELVGCISSQHLGELTGLVVHGVQLAKVAMALGYTVKDHPTNHSMVLQGPDGKLTFHVNGTLQTSGAHADALRVFLKDLITRNPTVLRAVNKEESKRRRRNNVRRKVAGAKSPKTSANAASKKAAPKVATSDDIVIVGGKRSAADSTDVSEASTPPGASTPPHGKRARVASYQMDVQASKPAVNPLFVGDEMITGTCEVISCPNPDDNCQIILVVDQVVIGSGRMEVGELPNQWRISLNSPLAEGASVCAVAVHPGTTQCSVSDPAIVAPHAPADDTMLESLFGGSDSEHLSDHDDVDDIMGNFSAEISADFFDVASFDAGAAQAALC